MANTVARPGYASEQALLDAAERLLVEVGAAGFTTRKVAEEAGSNHGLVHYYFGSIEQLLVRVLERFTERLIERQRQMYAADVPFLDRWRTAMGYLE
jgi:AcrR family transcriptional regulator